MWGKLQFLKALSNRSNSCKPISGYFDSLAAGQLSDYHLLENENQFVDPFVLDLRNTTFPEELSPGQSEQQEQSPQQQHGIYHSVLGYSHEQRQSQEGQKTNQNEDGIRGNTDNFDDSDYQAALSQDRLVNRAANSSLPYKCQNCQESFGRKCDLNKHIKTHTRPYKCTHSGCVYKTKGFPTQSEHDRHMATHLGQTAGSHSGYCPFSWCLMSRRPQRSDNLARHMRTKHRLEGYWSGFDN